MKSSNLRSQPLGDPLRIAAQVEDGPDRDDVIVTGLAPDDCKLKTVMLTRSV